MDWDTCDDELQTYHTRSCARGGVFPDWGWELSLDERQPGRDVEWGPAGVPPHGCHTCAWKLRPGVRRAQRSKMCARRMCAHLPRGNSPYDCNSQLTSHDILTPDQRSRSRHVPSNMGQKVAF
eukprot:scaffold269637_cov40-Tisochrysis_lutea.AAC.1